MRIQHHRRFVRFLPDLPLPPLVSQAEQGVIARLESTLDVGHLNIVRLLLTKDGLLAKLSSHRLILGNLDLITGQFQLLAAT